MPHVEKISIALLFSHIFLNLFMLTSSSSRLALSRVFIHTIYIYRFIYGFFK